MKITTTPYGTITLDFETSGNRACNGCTLCCKLLPNVHFDKPAGIRCQHQKAGKGCAIYAHRPLECEAWSCRWLAAPEETAGMRRPDRSHYVIDPLADTIRVTNNTTGQVTELQALQIWVDPAFPKTKDDPELRAYMLRMAKQYGLPSLLRWSNRRSTVIFPPPTAGDEWRIFDDAKYSEDIGRYSTLLTR